ncbi:MAG: TldD/PmbA family protein [Pseudanabaenaceae cyanobacterium]
MTSELERALGQAAELCQHYGKTVDYLAIRLEQAETTELLYQHGVPKTAQSGWLGGGWVRVCQGGGWGFASFDGYDTLTTAVTEAIAAARWLKCGQTRWAAVPPVQATVLLPKARDPRAVPLSAKHALCADLDAGLREAGEVKSRVSYRDSWRRVGLFTNEGTAIVQEFGDWELQVAATARTLDTVQTARATVGSCRSFAELLGMVTQAPAIAQRAVAATRYPVVPAGNYTVVIDPILAGLLVHEAFGHLSEADALSENPELQKTMRRGRRFGPANLHIWDGAVPGETHRGSYGYDDEGVPQQTTPLLENGVLVGRLHNRETAALLGEAPTGNARCLDYGYPPLVRMTNTWMAAGDVSPTDLWHDLKQGIYASNWVGGTTNGEYFTFTAGEAWRIRNGRKVEPLRDVTLTGNVFQTLKHIEAIGNDLTWDESGGCGKGGQDGLPVGCGAPSLRLRRVAIGGTPSPAITQ